MKLSFVCFASLSLVACGGKVFTAEELSRESTPLVATVEPAPPREPIPAYAFAPHAVCIPEDDYSACYLDGHPITCIDEDPYVTTFCGVFLRCMTWHAAGSDSPCTGNVGVHELAQ